jgi:single-strand selective monofunctional uracil DNA glycosylase
VGALTFSAPVTHVYNPLDYARAPHEQYLERFGNRAQTILVGMNPGPFGMMQTGVPFGDVTCVREFLKISARVTKPKHEHEKRLIDGFACTRKEVSGTRLWGFAQDRFGTADAFFDRFFVVNYCPLAFLAESGKNHTPDKLPTAEKQALFAACDKALLDTALAMKATTVIGIGAFAQARAAAALNDTGIRIGTILHPSPASPLANRGWAPQAEKQLIALGVM